MTETTKNVLKLFYSLETFNEKLNIFIGKPINEFEILLYSHKISLICSQSRQNSFYKKLMSNNIIKTIKENFIPGGEPNDNIRITTFKELEEYLRGCNDPNQAAYVCSCGYWYSVPPCGLPTSTSNCPICNQMIGGTEYKLVERDGHMRIYLNEEQRKEVSKRSYYIPFHSKLLNEYKSEVENLKMNDSFKGFRRVNIEYFLSNKKEVRNLNNISYRLLNFIFYSCIFYSKILGFLNEEQIK